MPYCINAEIPSGGVNHVSALPRGISPPIQGDRYTLKVICIVTKILKQVQHDGYTKVVHLQRQKERFNKLSS